MFSELQALFRKKFKNKLVSELRQFITTNSAQLTIEKLPLSATGLLSAALAENEAVPIVVLTATEEEAEEVYDSLRYFTAENCAFHFASWGGLPFDQDEPPLEVRAKQLETLASLIELQKHRNTFPPLIAVSIKAITQKFFTPEFLIARMFTISKGKSVDIAELIRRLVIGGYERLEIVESRGEFAVRGGIIDIYPPNLERPIRLDLFGNEVESIRYFDVYTQRSIKELSDIDRIVILPAREKLLIDTALNSDRLVSFFDWLPPSTVILSFNAEKFKEILDEHWGEIERHYAEAVVKKTIREEQRPEKLFLTFEQLNKMLSGFKQLIHRPLTIEDVREAQILNFQGQVFDGMPASLDSYLKYIQQNLSEGYVINIVCDNPGQVWRLEEILQEQGIPAIAEPPNPKRQNDRYYREKRNDALENYVLLTVGDLHSGFVLPECKLIFLTDREIFGRYKKRHIYRRFYKGIPVVSADEIRRGDFVVHVDYGIGKFLGIRQQCIDNKKVDLLAIEYQDNDKLLVPVDKIQYIQKYSGVEGYSPPLDKLGSKRWLIRKRKSQELIEKMAKELLEIYAQRALAEGYAYAPDSVWQTEFEATFPFEETPDQLQAIYEVKQDLQKPKPMDRLVCGDVAYGKTEVAIRAAFKVAQEKKQVALLAPTTILAQQHFRTFTERFSGFPIKIEMLSRFRSPKEQRDILHRLKYGDIDIIIGTHRLLSDDVEFCDLGLVIVDE
ncbi:MAG: DEAD/DEAH box helicase, partial [Candidatus Sumerlaeia bacterium]|nr:DEAD/DEAH box helicase [Candidatus Sumerlaeia bacterium]